jgi:hypothetical protein
MLDFRTEVAGGLEEVTGRRGERCWSPIRSPGLPSSRQPEASLLFNLPAQREYTSTLIWLSYNRKETNFYRLWFAAALVEGREAVSA